MIPDVIDIIINKGAVPRDSGQISLEIVVVEPLHTARFNKSSFRSWQTLFSYSVFFVKFNRWLFPRRSALFTIQADEDENTALFSRK